MVLKMVNKVLLFSCSHTMQLILNFTILYSATIGSGSCTGNEIKGSLGYYGYSCTFLQGKHLDSIR